ncbi:MAG: hypothetical protein AAGI88_21705 [Pseudomonadota bacterium]
MKGLKELRRRHLFERQVLARHQRDEWLWRIAFASVGVLLGFSLAMALVDPVTILMSCEGVAA